MNSNPRGLCVIINNENFTGPENKRNGSQKDVGRHSFTYHSFLEEMYDLRDAYCSCF